MTTPFIPVDDDAGRRCKPSFPSIASLGYGRGKAALRRAGPNT